MKSIYKIILVIMIIIMIVGVYDTVNDTMQASAMSSKDEHVVSFDSLEELPIPTITVTPTSTPVPTNTPTPIPTNTPIPTPTSMSKAYDVKMPAEHQSYLIMRSEQYGVEVEIAFSTVWRESEFNQNATNNKNKNKTIDAGYFQINSCNWDFYREVFGQDWDPYDPYDNIDAGVYHIAMCMKYDKNPTCYMMVYNMGYGGASRLWKQGIWSSEYTRSLVNYKNNVLPGLKIG